MTRAPGSGGVRLTEAAPAKVNLALHVTGRRTDGYHELESLVVFAGVGDELVARPAAKDRLAVTGPFGSAAGSGGANLVSRAVAGFRALWPGAVPFGLAIELRKNLPVAAGLGGGSADAAAALRLLVRSSAEAIPPDGLAALALTLGADVPVCLGTGPALVTGIGETVRRLAGFPACHLVLVNPLMPMATPDVFRRLERHVNAPLPPLPDPLARPAQLGLWLEETRNDLEASACAILPALGDVLGAMRAAEGAMLVRMSGSGATVFGLYGSAAQAHQAAHELRGRWPGFWIAAAPVLSTGA